MLTDTYGNKASRVFLIHPQVNVVPEIRITSPADEQEIVEGVFRMS